MRERRKFFRLPSDDNAVLEAEKGSQLQSQLLDVSSGGMRILTHNKNIKIGNTISGQFKINPNMGNFYVRGTVVWVTSKSETSKTTAYEIGIKFDKISTLPLP